MTPSVAWFKYKINTNLRSPPKFYNAGTRKIQIVHTRLLMECSSFKNSEYDQEIPQLQTADNPMAQRGRATQQSRDTSKTNQAKQPALSSSSR